MGKEQEKICISCGSSYPAAYSSCPRCQLPLVFPNIGKVWHVDKLIGRGGMGAVFLAHHLEDPSRLSAVKVLQLVVGEQRADRQEKVSRFQREAEALGRLKHPAIVELYDFARERDGSLYMAMEYLQGVPLSRVLKEQGPLEPADAVSLTLQVLAAVGAAHRVGIIHCDLKPDNIVVLRDPDLPEGSVRFDRVKVVDFGVARLKDNPATESGQALGTVKIIRAARRYGLLFGGAKVAAWAGRKWRAHMVDHARLCAMNARFEAAIAQFALGWNQAPNAGGSNVLFHVALRYRLQTKSPIVAEIEKTSLS